MRGVAAEYDVPYETLRVRIHRAQERHEAHAESRKLTLEQEKVDRTESNLTKWQAIVLFCLQLDDVGYPVETRHIRDLAASLTVQALGKLWLSRFLERHSETTVKLVTCIDKQRKAAEKPEVFRHYFAKVDPLPSSCGSNSPQLFNYIIENDIKPENIYNMDEKGFFIGRNKRRRAIVHGTKLPPFVIFRGLSHHIGNLIHAEREGKATSAHSKNDWTNIVLGRAWLEHFEKHTVNKHTIDAVNEPTVPEKRLLIMDGHSSHCSVEFFQFTGDYSIGLVCLTPHATHFLQSLDVGIFGPLANAYCLELDEWQQAGNTNINRGDFLALFKRAREKAETENNIKRAFEATGIWPMNAERVVKPAVAKEVIS